MKKILYTNPRIIIAEEGKKIKNKEPNIVELEDGSTKEEYTYSDMVFLAINIKEEDIDNLYEEVVE